NTRSANHPSRHLRWPAPGPRNQKPAPLLLLRQLSASSSHFSCETVVSRSIDRPPAPDGAGGHRQLLSGNDSNIKHLNGICHSLGSCLASASGHAPGPQLAPAGPDPTILRVPEFRAIRLFAILRTTF